MAGMAIPCHRAPARQMIRIMAMPARVRLPSLGLEKLIENLLDLVEVLLEKF